MGIFQNVIVPLVTCFNDDQYQSLAASNAQPLVEHLIASGVDGLFTFGSNGEFTSCTATEKIDYTSKILEYSAGRVRVIAGVGTCSTKESIELAVEMEKIGVDAISLVNPYFLPLSDAEIISHFRRIAEAVSIPCLLYNIPKGTGQSLKKAVVENLAQVENILGIKDSSGDLELIKKYLSVSKTMQMQGKEFSVLVGSDGKISDAFELGVQGCVAGTANLIPEIVVLLVQLLRGDVTETNYSTEELQQMIEPLRDIIHLGSTPAMLKRALHLAGFAVGPTREPVSTSSKFDENIINMLDFYRSKGCVWR